jgi:hypothetical protein
MSIRSTGALCSSLSCCACIDSRLVMLRLPNVERAPWSPAAFLVNRRAGRCPLIEDDVNLGEKRSLFGVGLMAQGCSLDRAEWIVKKGLIPAARLLRPGPLKDTAIDDHHPDPDEAMVGPPAGPDSQDGAFIDRPGETSGHLQ